MHPADASEQSLMKEGPTIPELYFRTDAADPASNYDTSLFTPQVLTTCAAPHLTCPVCTCSYSASPGWRSLDVCVQRVIPVVCTLVPGLHQPYPSGSAAMVQS